jgi:hypothetical protein
MRLRGLRGSLHYFGHVVSSQPFGVGGGGYSRYWSPPVTGCVDSGPATETKLEAQGGGFGGFQRDRFGFKHTAEGR